MSGCLALNKGGGWKVLSLWTVLPSFTFQAGGLPLLSCSSYFSLPAWLLMCGIFFFFFFLLLPSLSWGLMDSGLSPKAEVCFHLSLSPVLFPSAAPLQFLYSYLQELGACVGNRRAE